MPREFPPDLPAEEFRVRLVYLVDPMVNIGHTVTASRNRNSRSEVDSIGVDASYVAPAGMMSAQIIFSPAMIVHMANTLLTDSERAAILAPAIAGAESE